MLEESWPPHATDSASDQQQVFRMTVSAPIEANHIPEIRQASAEFLERVGTLTGSEIKIDIGFRTSEEEAAQQAMRARFAQWWERYNAAQERVKAAGLSPQESEVMGYVASGLSNRAIGQKLHLAEATIKGNVSAAMGKLGVSSRTELAAIALILF